MHQNHLESVIEQAWCVAVYFVDVAYGGPEEGGWYYEEGRLASEPEHVLNLKAFNSIDDATAYAQTLNDDLDRTVNMGRPPIHSELFKGCYRAIVTEGLPAPFPEDRPYYE